MKLKDKALTVSIPLVLLGALLFLWSIYLGFNEPFVSTTQKVLSPIGGLLLLSGAVVWFFRKKIFD